MLKENQKFSFAYQVKPSDLAQNLAISDEDDHPPVLATAKMILLMEVACARMMQPLVRDRELSAGVDVSIRHLAATLCDEEVTIEATFKGIEGKLYRFDVEVYDRGGLVGSGQHTRAIIDHNRLLEGAQKRYQKQP